MKTQNPNKGYITPSQLVNLPYFLLFLASIAIGVWFYVEWIIIPFGLFWLWKFAVIQCWQYHFDYDSDTMFVKKGVFSVRSVEIHYFRIKSVQVFKPFLLRIFGLSTVVINTSEPFMPTVVLYGIKQGDEWAQYFKDVMIYWREENDVKETDFHSF